MWAPMSWEPTASEHTLPTATFASANAISCSPSLICCTRAAAAIHHSCKRTSDASAAPDALERGARSTMTLSEIPGPRMETMSLAGSA
eukprot:4348692-Pyramimonas_sp.AAC.1